MPKIEENMKKITLEELDLLLEDDEFVWKMTKKAFFLAFGAFLTVGSIIVLLNAIYAL